MKICFFFVAVEKDSASEVTDEDDYVLDADNLYSIFTHLDSSTPCSPSHPTGSSEEDSQPPILSPCPCEISAHDAIAHEDVPAPRLSPCIARPYASPEKPVPEVINEPQNGILQPGIDYEEMVATYKEISSLIVSFVVDTLINFLKTARQEPEKMSCCKDFMTVFIATPDFTQYGILIESFFDIMDFDTILY